MNIQLMESAWPTVACDALLIPVFEDEPWQQGLVAELNQLLDGLLTELRESGEWNGGADKLAVVYRPKSIRAGRVVLLGLGKRSDYDVTVLRNAITRGVLKFKIYALARVAVLARDSLDRRLLAQASVEAVVLGSYEPDEYKTVKRSRILLDEITIVAKDTSDRESLEKVMHRGRILGEATNLARTLVNQPGNRMNPSLLAEKAREVAERFGLGIDVLGESEIEEKGMGALLAVARGSDEPARLIVLRHDGAGPDGPLTAALVGKGVTFDSGGLSLKPADSMEDMKGDKGGACAVLGAMQALAQLQVPRNVIGIIPAVENLPSGRAQRPGDVVCSMSGKTIEVLNTDAEGRLILADAISYANEFNPGFIIDLATLTGACVVALGTLRAGVFSNDDALCQRLLKASERAGERLWRLPLDVDYRTELDSTIADIKNVGDRWGGAITAAKFLQEFVGDRPWCHLDIAGVNLLKICKQVKSPTGFGVRTLVELLLDD